MAKSKMKKRVYNNLNQQLRQNWKKLMDSDHNKLSMGAENNFKVMTVAHKDEWRRGHGKRKLSKKSK